MLYRHRTSCSQTWVAVGDERWTHDPVASRKTLQSWNKQELASFATEIVSDDQFSLLEEFQPAASDCGQLGDKLPFDCVVTANETRRIACTCWWSTATRLSGTSTATCGALQNLLREHGMRRVLGDMRFPFDENNRVR